MKRVGKPVFFVILVLVLAFATLSIFGIHSYYGDVKTSNIKGIGNIRWGTEFAQGVEVTFAPQEDAVVDAKALESARRILEARLVSQGYRSAQVVADEATQELVATFPWGEAPDSIELKQMLTELKKAQFLTLREGSEYDQNTFTPAGHTAEAIFLDSTHVKKARATTSASGYPVVELTFHREGKKILEDTTRDIVTGEIDVTDISAWMDNQLLSLMQVEQVITKGSMYLPGSPTEQVANTIADLINAGPLPFTLEMQDVHTVSSELPTSAWQSLVIVGVVLFVAVALLLFFFFRMGGLVAIVSLIGQFSLVLAATTGFLSDVNGPIVTMASIIGFVMVLVLGVATNLYTLRTIQQDLSIGKSLDGAVDTGFTHSFPLVLDATLLLSLMCIVLLVAFKGGLFAFAQAFFAGLLGNLLFNVWLNRWMMRSLLRFPNLRKAWYFGGEKK